jgi:hypothetical protein
LEATGAGGVVALPRGGESLLPAVEAAVWPPNSSIASERTYRIRSIESAVVSPAQSPSMRTTAGDHADVAQYRRSGFIGADAEP